MRRLNRKRARDINYSLCYFAIDNCLILPFEFFCVFVLNGLSTNRYRILKEIDRVSLKEWTRNRYGAQLIVVVGLIYSILMHLPHFMQYDAIQRPCNYLCHDAEHGIFEQQVGRRRNEQ